MREKYDSSGYLHSFGNHTAFYLLYDSASSGWRESACLKKSGDKKMIKAFSKYNIRESGKDYNEYFFSGLRDKAMHELGLGTARNMHSVITQISFPSLRCRAYTQKERKRC